MFQVSSLLRTEDGFRLLVAVSLHQRSQCPLQEVPTPYAGIQGKGNDPNTSSGSLGIGVH